ncbi:MAG: hypothetical protein WCD18_23200 [Thermosynechococcaceae cyanobacterium]
MRSHPFLLGTAITISAIAIAPAQASLYRSTSGNTELRIAEWHATRSDRPGSYTTHIGNQTWNGSLQVKAEGGPTNLMYQGTFADSPMGNTQIQCTGAIAMNRRAIGAVRGMDLEVRWTVTGGNQCPAIGKTFAMTLPEALPVADNRGDYTQSWGRWQVTSADGKLNCRATPNGTVIHTFRRGDEIFLDGRLGQTISLHKGSPWMYVPYLSYPYSDANYKPCYVRANVNYIEPLSIGF